MRMAEARTRSTWLWVLSFACIDCAGPAFSSQAVSEEVAGSGGASPRPDSVQTAGVASQGGSADTVTPQSGGAAGEPAVDDAPENGGSDGAKGGAPTGGMAFGGTASVTACPAPLVGALRVAVCQERDDPFAPGDHASAEPHPFLLLTNGGANISLSRVKVRYFFSAELAGSWQADYFWATKLNGAPADPAKGFAPGPRLDIRAWSPTLPGADHRLELSFDRASTVVLSSGQSLEVRAWFRTSADGKLVQADDWSFAPSSKKITSVEGCDYRENARITLYVDDQLVWGAEPCRAMSEPATL